MPGNLHTTWEGGHFLALHAGAKHSPTPKSVRCLALALQLRRLSDWRIAANNQFAPMKEACVERATSYQGFHETCKFGGHLFLPPDHFFFRLFFPAFFFFSVTPSPSICAPLASSFQYDFSCLLLDRHRRFASRTSISGRDR